MEWQKKRDEYEAVKARTKLGLSLCTICGAKNAKLCQGCGTTAYCSTDCQRIDWRDRGHRKACKKIRDERAAEAARAEAPTPPAQPVFYGPAPRSHADEVRARIAAEHEAARARREANPEREPESARFGSRCPICLEEWDVNETPALLVCCCRLVCDSCAKKVCPCPLCRAPGAGVAEQLARLRRHVEQDIPEAIYVLGTWYYDGNMGLVKSAKKAAKIYKRAVELGNVNAMVVLGYAYEHGDGVKLDARKANQLYKMAADLGHAMAQTNLGNNNARAGNWAAAISYFKSAASQGFINAFFGLGICFENCEGGLDEAKRWYARAAAKGHEDARADLERLSR
jgi:tetratricopeptide (TPR) repeat protein